MAVPPPRYASRGTIRAIVSHAAAVSGGRILRTRSDGMERVLGEVACERPPGRLKAACCRRVLPGVCGQVRGPPGEAIGIKGRDELPGDERRRGRDIELGRCRVPEEVQQMWGNPLGVRPGGDVRARAPGPPPRRAPATAATRIEPGTPSSQRRGSQFPGSSCEAIGVRIVTVPTVFAPILPEGKTTQQSAGPRDRPQLR